jgi:hypothetical protein
MNVRDIGHSLQQRLLGRKESDEASNAKRPEKAAGREGGREGVRTGGTVEEKCA